MGLHLPPQLCLVLRITGLRPFLNCFCKKWVWVKNRKQGLKPAVRCDLHFDPYPDTGKAPTGSAQLRGGDLMVRATPRTRPLPLSGGLKGLHTWKIHMIKRSSKHWMTIWETQQKDITFPHVKSYPMLKTGGPSRESHMEPGRLLESWPLSSL